MTESIRQPEREPAGDPFALRAAERLLDIVARVYTAIPRRTPRGLVPGKVFIGTRDYGHPAELSPAAKRVRDALERGALGRAKPSHVDNFNDLRRDRLDPQDRSASRSREWTTEVAMVRPGLEIAAMRLARWRLRVTTRLLENGSDTSRTGELYIEPVPAFRLATGFEGSVTLDGSETIAWDPSFEAVLAHHGSPMRAQIPGDPISVLVLDTGVSKDVLDRSRAPPGEFHHFGNFVRRGANLAPEDIPAEYRFEYQDAGSHGTLVAAIIARLMPNAAIHSGRVAEPTGEGRVVDGSFLAFGLDVAYDQEPMFDVVNISMGDGRLESLAFVQGLYNSETLGRHLGRLARQGATIVAAAGNDQQANIDDDVAFPARDPRVWAVGSTNRNGHRSRFSRRGPMKPDLMAYGGDVDAAGQPLESLGTLSGKPATGTSFACAIVSGLAAHRFPPGVRNPNERAVRQEEARLALRSRYWPLCSGTGGVTD